MKLILDLGDVTIKEMVAHDLTQAMKDCVKFILNQKVGYVQVNFFKGGITTTNIYETKKRTANE